MKHLRPSPPGLRTFTSALRALLRVLCVQKLALAFAAALVAGCAVGPDYQPVAVSSMLPAGAAPVDPGPSSPRTPATSTGPSWWRAFGDADLTSLVETALIHSPDIEAADAAVRQSRALYMQAASAGQPQVDLQGRVGRDQVSTDSEGFANIPFPNPQTLFSDYRAGLDASWEIDLFGHTRRAIESVEAQADASVAQRADVALRVSAETTRNVLDHRHLTLRLRNAQDVSQQRARLLDLVRRQRLAGMASDLEVAQAETALRNAEAAIPPLRVAADASLLALVPLTGLSRDALAVRLQTSAPLPPLPDAGLFAMSSTVLQRRPDVRQAERRLASATASVGMAVADQYPRFTLVGSLGWDSIRPERFGEQASQYWSVGPQLYLPLFNGGRVNSEIHQNEAARDSALAIYRKTVLSALSEVETAMLRCKADVDQVQGVTSAYAALDHQWALTGARVNAGEASQLDLVSADLLRLAQNEQRLSTRQAQADDLVLLFRALDGGIDGPATPVTDGSASGH